MTELEYVRSLSYILTHYLPLLARPDVPPDLRGQRGRIFGNLEKLYDFHCNYFLQELEACRTEPLRVGRCFLRHVSSSVYVLTFFYTVIPFLTLFIVRNNDVFVVLGHFNELFFGGKKEDFGLYALYSKNKPQSDALVRQHKFFKVWSD